MVRATKEGSSESVKHDRRRASTPHPGEEDLSERHRELIDISARIFRDKGYDGASIQDIADELGILKGSVYYYVKSKDDLLFAVINRVHEAALNNVADFPHEGVTPLEDIRTFVHRHVMHSVEDIIGATVFFRDFRSLTKERRSIVLKERDRYTSVLVDLIERAVEDGSARTDMTVRALTLAILGMTNWVYQWYRPNSEPPVDEIANNFAQLAVEMVAKKSDA